MKRFDFLTLAGVECKCFVMQPGDDELISSLVDLEDTRSDPLAGAVRGAITSLARSLGLLTPGDLRGSTNF